MDDDELEKRLAALERRQREQDRRLRELDERERRLHNLTLRLAATGMAVSEALQRHRLIDPAEFEQRVQGHLQSLDREISQKKTARYLEDLWKERGEPEH